MELPDKIRVLRERKGLTQSQMAKELNMTVTGYGKIERSEVGVNQYRLEKIAQVFEVTPSMLMAEEELEVNTQTEIQFLKMLLLEKDKRIQALEREINFLYKTIQ